MNFTKLSGIFLYRNYDLSTINLYTYPHIRYRKELCMANQDLGSIWEKILTITKQTMNPELWETSIHTGLLPVSLTDTTLTVGVIQNYLKPFIEKNKPIYNKLQEATNEACGMVVNISIISFQSPEQSEESMAPSSVPPTKDTNEPLPPISDDASSYQHNIASSQPMVSPTPVAPLPSTTTVEQIQNKSQSLYDEPVYIDPHPSDHQNGFQLFPDEKPFVMPVDTPPAPTPSSNKIIDLTESNLNPAFTFESFINGNSNRVAYASAQYVGEQPGERYNPLFIYGQSGLGKTHLMHAIGNRIVETKPHLKVMCITSENFTNIFINSLKDKQNESFRNTFRNIDVLLVDDIQFLQNKESTQEEFFHTFNALLDSPNKKQIVLTSDILPKDMVKMENRLRSRFEAAMIVTIEQPDFETRTAILRANIDKERVKAPDLQIDQKVITFIAEQFNENVRKLQGAFNRLIGAASLEGKLNHIDMDYALRVLADLIKNKPVHLVTIEFIQDFIADYFKIKKSDLLSKKRNVQYVFPRQIAMYLCRELINESYPQIASAFGKKDHTTILHAYEKICREIDRNDRNNNTRRMIDEIREKINSCS